MPSLLLAIVPSVKDKHTDDDTQVHEYGMPIYNVTAFVHVGLIRWLYSIAPTTECFHWKVAGLVAGIRTVYAHVWLYWSGVCVVNVCIYKGGIIGI